MDHYHIDYVIKHTKKYLLILLFNGDLCVTVIVQYSSEILQGGFNYRGNFMMVGI